MRFHLILWIFIAAFISPATLEAQSGKGATALNTADTEALADKNLELKTPEDFYAAGKYSEAAILYLRTEGSRRNRLTAYYNAARCLHQDYIDNQSLESLSAAVDGYYRVLDLNPEHHEALINLEMARLELEKYDAPESQDDQQSGENSENQKDGQGQNDNNDLSKLAEDQKDLADSDKGQENSEKQSSLKEKTEQARDQSEQNSQARESLDQAIEKQKEAIEQMNQGNEQDAKEAQQDAASLLEQAAQSASESQNQDDSDSLPQDIQSILNQEQGRKQDKQDAEDMIRVEKNW